MSRARCRGTSQLGLTIAAAVLAGGLGFYLAGHLDGPPEPNSGAGPGGDSGGGLGAGPVGLPTAVTATPKRMVGRARPGFELPDAAGKPRSISEWDGHVVVLNFWATWCAPCREEVPVLVSIQRRYRSHGLRVLGVAVDRPAAVEAFNREFEVNYPSLFARNEAMEIGKRYGNVWGSLPYTVIIDSEGVVRFTHFGPVRAADLEEVVRGLVSG